MIKEFAIYKGEELIVMGTAKECADHMGVTPDYIKWMVTPTGRKRLANRKNPERCTTAVLLDDD